MKLKTMLCTTMLFAFLTATQAFAAPGIFNQITDGEDNSSNTRLKEFVRQTFPIGAINLFIIAVGSHSDVDEFASTADLVLAIDNFGVLPDAIITVLNHA